MVMTPGIYFGLSNEAYHADPALGSTGIKRLLSSPPDFWWQSAMNPARPEETTTPAKEFGTALHKCVLEGRDAFLAEFAAELDPAEYPGCLRVVEDIKVFLKANGAAQGGNKPDLVKRAKEYLDCPPIFDEMVAELAKDRTVIKRDDFNRILAAAAFIKANPFMANAFTDGHPEISVFWERDGVMFKSRFDYLKHRATVDLKSIRNPLGKEFRKACTDRIAEYGYLTSAEHYNEGRRQMAGLVDAGLVFGEHDPVWIREVAEETAFAFVLVFWQADGSPISWGTQISPGNELFEMARFDIKRGVELYREFMQEFGSDAAWMLNEPIKELSIDQMPGWWISAFNKGK
jgi:hypothetical protein